MRDTLYADKALKYPPIPRFPAEHFGVARLRDVRFKQFDEAIRQLEEEGLMQVFYVTSGKREPIVGVVGALQFDVIASRLRTEYGVEVQVDAAPYAAARWLAEPLRPVPSLGGGATVAVNRQDRRLIVAER